MDLNIHLKSVISRMTCTTHDQKAILEINNKNISLECCCASFKIECLNKCVEVLEGLHRSDVFPALINDQCIKSTETKVLTINKMTHDYNIPCFFSVNHITKPFPTKLIYGIKFKKLIYYLFKSLGIDDCEQLDNNPVLERAVFENMCKVITEIEIEYKKVPPIQYINLDIFNILVRAENLRYYDPE